jgi:predicted transcriptional regulator
MQKQNATEGFTPLELEVMKALWVEGPATVQEVHRRMAETRHLAYNTVQTVLNILHRKGKVARRSEQRAYVYRALVSREQAGEGALQTLVDRLFGGRPEDLVLSMVKNRQLNSSQLAELQRMVEKEGEADDSD